MPGLNTAGHFAAFLLLISLIAGRARIRPFLQAMKESAAWPLPLVLGALALPSLFTAVVTYPEPAPLLPAALVFWGFAGAWLAYAVPKLELTELPWLPTAALAGVAILVTPFSHSPWNHESPPDRPNLRMHNALSRLELKTEPLEILVADDYRGYAAYQSPRWVRLPPWERTAPLKTFLEKRGVGILVTHPGQPFLPEKEWQEFERDPQRWGFRRIPVHRHSSIYVRHDLLLPSPKISAR